MTSLRLPEIPRFILVGPTATGKTEAIHAIARAWNAGVISADAMMVYRGMDIGTAKPTPAERAGIPYAGLDLADPSQAFSVHDYLRGVIDTMAAHPGVRTWLVAGGTGLYVRCLLKGFDEQEGANPALRAEAETILADQGFHALMAWCQQRDPDIRERLPEGDRGNARRWIRALERGPVLPSDVPLPDDVRIAGLCRDRAELEARIVRRVDDMFARGLVEEVRSLRAGGVEWSPTARQAIGYAEAAAVLDGRMTAAAARERTVIRTRQYAKRQMTWFRHQLPTRWFSVCGEHDMNLASRRIMEYWSSHD